MLLNSGLIKHSKTPTVSLLVSLALYTTFAYDLVRTEATKLILLYLALFSVAYVLKKSAGFNFGFLVLASILIRLVFLPAIPNLSQDFYRFIWDGCMLFEGFNPYLYTPDSFIQNGQFPISQAQELYHGMGVLSASHHTNYPPLNQILFYIGNLFPGESILSSVIGMRLIIISADIGTLYFGKKLLEALKVPSSRIWWYILNPFIIIELTGNLHFEGVMIFFLVWSLYLLHIGKWKWAAIILACSISVKLIPLMFLPLYFWWFTKNKDSKFPNLKRLISFYAIVLGLTVVLFVPFFSMKFINNYSQTVGLWFNDFEFNASIYYILREVGYWITGYNQIGTIGKILPVISILIILYYSFYRRNIEISTLISSMLLCLCFYLFFSTTVHPWYLSTLVILCIFTRFRFPLAWSVVIILSYLSYLTLGTASKSENLWVIGLEYVIVFLVFIWEVFLKKSIKI